MPPFQISDAARASVNVNLNPNLLSNLAAKVNAPRSLTVHRVVDLSRASDVEGMEPEDIEARVSQMLAPLQVEAASEVQSCRFRPTPNILISLRLHETPLGPTGIQGVAQALLMRAPLTLHVLSLAGCGLGDEGVSSLTGALGATSAVHLLSLDLCDNGLTHESGTALAVMLAARTQRLEELRLSRNPLGDSGVAAVSNGLVANNTLRKLYLAQVGVGAKGVHALAGALRHHIGLSTLHIHTNPPLQGRSGSAAVAELLACGKSLEKFWAGGSALGPSAASHLIAAVEAMVLPPGFPPPSQQPVAILGGGFDVVADPLGNGGSPDPLGLNSGGEEDPTTPGPSASMVGPAGSPDHEGSSGLGSPNPESVAPTSAPTSAGRLQPRPAVANLNFLWLERAKIQSEGVHGIVALLTSTHIALTELWLGGNELGDDAAEEIGDALPSAISLRKLHLEHNKFTYRGAEVLLHAAMSSGWLRELFLDGNLLSPNDCRLINDHWANEVGPQHEEHTAALAAHAQVGVYNNEPPPQEPFRLYLRDPRGEGGEELPQEPINPNAPPVGYRGHGEWSVNSGWRHPLAAQLMDKDMLQVAQAEAERVAAEEEAAAMEEFGEYGDREMPTGEEAMQSPFDHVDSPMPEPSPFEDEEEEEEEQGEEEAPPPPPEAEEQEQQPDTYAEAEAEAEAAVAELEAAVAAADTEDAAKEAEGEPPADAEAEAEEPAAEPQEPPAAAPAEE